ncbi:MAG: homogentisate 1,2-dioxygenase [Bdellovibrionales bacterium]
MFQYSQGRFTTQGHKGIPEGHFEEEQGRRGFFGAVSHLIKPAPSTRWENIEGDLRPHLFDAVEMPKKYGQWQRMLFNSEVALYNLWLETGFESNNSAFRNADGDLLYFCHKGEGHVLTEFGALDYRAGSYIHIPKCATHAFLPKVESNFLIIESKTSAYREPDRGMAGKNAFYDPACFGKPNLQKMHDLKKDKKSQFLKVVARRKEKMTTFTYSDCYFDTIGWKGDFWPFTLHISDLMPLLSARVHLPPSAHTTFVANGFVVCTFLPRPLETDADALKVPFYHQNIDYDEVLFYHDGNFFSRDNLHAGMLTLHPAGFPHGPHPKAVKNIGTKTHTDEVAVMIDTWNNLEIDSEFMKVEKPDYWKSWMAK